MTEAEGFVVGDMKESKIGRPGECWAEPDA